MEIISNIALISINETLLVQVICFLIFLFIMNRIMIRPLRGAREDRAEYIDKLGADITKAQQEMQAIADRIATQEAEARKAALSIQKDIIDQGSREAGGILAAAKEEVVALRQQTNAEIEATLAKFSQTVEQEAEAVAVNFMEKALDRRLNP